MTGKIGTVETVVLWIVLAFFGGIGAMVFLSGIRDAWWALTSSNWPRATGRVEESAEDGRRYFTYEVQGTTYRSNRVRFGKQLGEGSQSDRDLEQFRYATGTEVSMAHQPGNPAVAAARPGLYGGVFLAPVAGLVLVLAGLLMFLVGRAMELGDAVIPHVVRIFVAVFVLAGAAMIVAGGINLWHALASARWPVAEGEIVAVEGREHRSEDENTMSYGVSLVYAYTVNSFTYHNNQRRFGEIVAAGEDWANMIAVRYQRGSPVQVRYNRTDPNVSVLEPGIKWDVWAIPAAGLAFFLFGVAAWVWGIPALTKPY